MTENLVSFAIVLLICTTVRANLDAGRLKKKDIADKGPVLSAILENLFLPEECIYYTKLSSFDRSMDYKSGEYNLLCDAELSSGWYRFTKSAGSQMATTCVPPDHCSALNPGWLAGDHPSINDGKVDRKVCFHDEDNCCRASVNVQIRNCGPFYVYKLIGVPCPFRYCGGNLRQVVYVTKFRTNTLPPFPTKPEKPTTLPPFPTEPEETTTLPPFPTEPEETTAQAPTTLPMLPPYDECLDYKILDEPDRAASFYNPFVVMGDFNLSTDWYRFTKGAGTKMADKCVQVFHCGTHAPGWLLGGHPTNAKEHAVEREVCFNWNNDCCLFKGNVYVRQCGDFFIYRIRPMDYKYLRYCGNA